MHYLNPKKYREHEGNCEIVDHRLNSHKCFLLISECDLYSLYDLLFHMQLSPNLLALQKTRCNVLNPS